MLRGEESILPHRDLATTWKSKLAHLRWQGASSGRTGDRSLGGRQQTLKNLSIRAGAKLVWASEASPEIAVWTGLSG